MSVLSRWLRTGLPITVVLFCLATMRTVSRYPSPSGTGFAESMTGFGFPLSWYAASATTSNASKVALVPLAVDLLVYALAVMLLQWLVADRLMRGLHLSSRALKMIGVALWVAAALCAAAAAVIMTPNLRVDVMTVDDYFNGEGIIRQRSPVLGFLPQER